MIARLRTSIRVAVCAAVCAAAAPALALGPHRVTQVVEAGFGDPTGNWSISAATSWNGAAYFGTGGPVFFPRHGAEIWRTHDGETFERVATDGIGPERSNAFVLSLLEFQGMLYAGTASLTKGGRMYRTANGTDWEAVSEAGFGDKCNTGMTALVEFKDQLYVGTWSTCFEIQGGNGNDVWRTSNGVDWERTSGDGFGGGFENSDLGAWLVHGDYLYGTVENFTDGMSIVRTADGENWETVLSGGFGTTLNSNAQGFAFFEGFLNVGTWNASGTQLLRALPPGDVWERSADSPTNLNPNHSRMRFTVQGEYLIAATLNEAGGEGTGVFRKRAGMPFETVADGGFGIPATRASTASALFDGSVFVGTFNDQTGATIWRVDPPLDDLDADALADDEDNCPGAYNPDQLDGDEDGYGAACDCDDGDTAKGAEEILGDGIDNDCDGATDEPFATVAEAENLLDLVVRGMAPEGVTVGTVVGGAAVLAGLP